MCFVFFLIGYKTAWDACLCGPLYDGKWWHCPADNRTNRWLIFNKNKIKDANIKKERLWEYCGFSSGEYSLPKWCSAVERPVTIIIIANYDHLLLFLLLCNNFCLFQTEPFSALVSGLPCNSSALLHFTSVSTKFLSSQFICRLCSALSRLSIENLLLSCLLQYASVTVIFINLSWTDFHLISSLNLLWLPLAFQLCPFRNPNFRYIRFHMRIITFLGFGGFPLRQTSFFLRSQLC